MPSVFPKATVRHWLTGRCAAADGEARDTIHKGMKGAVRIAKRIEKQGGGKEVVEVCERAAAAAKRAKENHTVTEGEYESIAQVIGAQLPNIAGTKEVIAAKELGNMDGVRRLALKAASDQIMKARNMGWGVVERRERREEHRGWLKLTLRAWAAVSQKRHIGVPRLETLERAEKDAGRENVRRARRLGWVEVEGRGKGKKLIRTTEQLWWARLRQRVVTLAVWALEVRGDTMSWYVRGEGCRAQPVGVRTGGAGGRVDERRQGGGERRKVAIPATQATREGARLAWWLLQGEGADARGPISVERGAPMPTHR